MLCNINLILKWWIDSFCFSHSTHVWGVLTWQALSILSFHLPCTTPNQAAHTRPFSFLWWWFLASMVVKDCRREEEAVTVVHANTIDSRGTLVSIYANMYSHSYCLPHACHLNVVFSMNWSSSVALLFLSALRRTCKINFRGKTFLSFSDRGKGCGNWWEGLVARQPVSVVLWWGWQWYGPSYWWTVHRSLPALCSAPIPHSADATHTHVCVCVWGRKYACRFIYYKY